MNVIEGFLETSIDGRARVMFVDGGFVDVAREQVVAAEVVGVHESGLTLWQVTHTDSTAQRQLFDDAKLNGLFEADNYQPFAGRGPQTGSPCIPPTIPDCAKSDFRHCFP
jgi:hypothetical protein